MTRLWTLVCLVLAGCAGMISPPPSNDGGLDGGANPMLDGGTMPSVDGGACPSAVAVAEFFRDEGCTNCHSGGTLSPDLRFAGLAALINTPSRYRPGHLIVVPGQPNASELWLRLHGPRPTDYSGSWWMPVGSAGAHPNPAVVEAWISKNAELECGDGMKPPDPLPVTNPNRYVQATLFTCADPTAPRSSPAHLRRINSLEYSLAAANPVESRWSDGTVESNPLQVEGVYSTQAGRASIDVTTLDLMLSTLDPVSYPFTTRATSGPNGGRYWTVYDGTPSNFYTAASPPDADRNVWVDRLLRQGTLFRSPTSAERAQLRAFLDAELTREAANMGKRADTLTTVASAAHLMSGALFRSELGGGPGSRRRLGDEELALSLGRFLATSPVSSTLFGDVPVGADAGAHPDWSRRAEGRFTRIRDAVDGGAIQDRQTIVNLLKQYRGGTDPYRIDLMSATYRADEHAQKLRERGEFWLSEGITRFFREWLDVKKAGSVFKQDPSASSAWSGVRANVVATGYDSIQPRLVGMLDDTIARAVIEAEESGQDVFKALLTTRIYRVTTNLDGVDYSKPCTVPADCGDFRLGICYTNIGFCAAYGSSETNRVFNLSQDIPDTHVARWVTMPAGERAGVLTHPAFLTAHGDNLEDDASLILRGHWIRENLLCTAVPGLELVAVPAMLGNHAPMMRARDRVSAATEGAGSPCVVCHSQMNPYGYAFELYNHAGYLRQDDHGRAPDGTATITNSPDPALNRSYANPIELTQALADSPYARRCFIRNVFRSFMGRNETPADACTLVEMETAFAGGSFFKMLEVLATSDTFLYRQDQGSTP